ncbi:MAG: hypothetical protein ACERKZ_09750 [Lachnotalea sp.]
MKKKFFFAVSLIILITICILFQKEFRFSKTGLTLLDAYKKGYGVAHTLNKDSMLYTMTSADVEGQKEHYEGIKGIRNNWNIDFAVPDSTTHYIIQIENGKIIKTSKTVGVKKYKNELIASQDLLINSPEALKIAKKSFGIKKGKIWAIGYHYTVHKIKNQTCIIVTASDIDDQLTRITIDATAGNIVNAEHKIQLGGGLYFGDSLLNVIDKFEVTGITETRDSSIVALWGGRLINTIEYYPEIMYQYNEEGWKRLQTKDDIRNIIILDEIKDKIIVVYTQKVEIFDLQTKKWTSLVTNNQILGSGSNGKTAFLITNKNIISIDSKLRLDYLLDFTNNTLPVTEDVVDIGINGTIYFGCANKICFFYGEELKSIDLFESNILDIKIKDDYLYILSEKQIYIYDVNVGFVIFSTDNKNSLVNFIDDQSSNKILCLDGDSHLFQIETKESDWKIIQLKTPDKNVYGNLRDILINKEGKCYYATQSISKWMELSKKE